MDETCEKILNKTPLPNSILYSHEALKSFKPALKLLQIERTTAEYFFTCSAQVCEFIMRRNPNIDILNYIDVDLCFFSSPEPIFRELGTSSIGIIEHNFHWTAQAKKKYGIYNVGWISFRNDEIGLKCISDWAEDCVNWCYQRVENDLYADQKYLDLWSKKYKGLKVIKNKGANLAIWNIKNYKIHNFLERGSDERQFNSPGVDLPISSIFRSKYGTYKEYHTSLDNFNLVTRKGLQGGFAVAKQAILNLDKKVFPKYNFLCEPMLGKRNLYNNLSIKGSSIGSIKYLDFLQYSNGKKSLEAISKKINLNLKTTKLIYRILLKNKLIHTN